MIAITLPKIFSKEVAQNSHTTYRASNPPHTKIIFIQISRDGVRMKI